MLSNNRREKRFNYRSETISLCGEISLKLPKLSLALAQIMLTYHKLSFKTTNTVDAVF